ncbi:MAG: plasmid replication protein, CyRepA1 family, partial [Dolichospermum sp.]
DIVNISLNQQFLTLEDLKIPDNAQLICIKSGKGTGKTEVLRAIAEKASSQGIAVLPIGHRVKLLSELCQRLGIDYRTDKSETKSYLGYALCFNSLHSQANPPFKPENWHGAYIFLDEIEQSLDYLLNSSLDGLKRYRVAILDTFRDLLREAIAGGGKIILSDAYLSKRSIACIQKLLGMPVEAWVVQNTYVRETPRSLIRYESKAKMLAALLDHIHKGGRPYILSGSQAASSKTSTQNLAIAIKHHCPDRFPVAIDSETTADPHHQAYKIEDNLRDLLPKIDIPIVSPSLETGISIEGSDFDSVWCFASQAQSVDGVCQGVDRYRANVPRHLCAPKTHTNLTGNGSLNARDLLRGEKRKATAIFRELSDLDHISLYEGESAALVTTWA